MAKSPDAFRTISEVSERLDVPAHVLRFWESKFSAVAPVKRAGGRRYYRPDDVALIGGIKFLLHEQGMTIKGVQKILRDSGAEAVAELAAPELLTAPQNAAKSPEKRVIKKKPHSKIVPPAAQHPVEDAQQAVLFTKKEEMGHFEARLLPLLPSMDAMKLKRKSKSIAPLLARLTKIHPQG